MSPAKSKRRSPRRRKSKSESMRLQRFLSECGVASRRKAEELIRAGEVTVNGKKAEIGMSVDPKHDVVRVGRRQVSVEVKGVVLFNKPHGVVSTMRDPHGRKSIKDFLPDELKSYFPVGRLDYESCGLVVLTNDGELANLMMHPRYEVSRRYEVKVLGDVPEEVCAKAAKGVQLEDGMVAAHARIFKKGKGTTWLSVSLHVGRNRIVRRLFDELGYPVVFLKRVSHGPFTLGTLRVGELKEISKRHYQYTREKLLKRRAGE